jgi:hypothetical protein
MKSASRSLRYTDNVPYFSGDINILLYVVNLKIKLEIQPLDKKLEN